MSESWNPCKGRTARSMCTSSACTCAMRVPMLGVIAVMSVPFSGRVIRTAKTDDGDVTTAKSSENSTVEKAGQLTLRGYGGVACPALVSPMALMEWPVWCLCFRAWLVETPRESRQGTHPTEPFCLVSCTAPSIEQFVTEKCRRNADVCRSPEPRQSSSRNCASPRLFQGRPSYPKAPFSDLDQTPITQCSEGLDRMALRERQISTLPHKVWNAEQLTPHNTSLSSSRPSETVRVHPPAAQALAVLGAVNILSCFSRPL